MNAARNCPAQEDAIVQGEKAVPWSVTAMQTRPARR